MPAFVTPKTWTNDVDRLNATNLNAYVRDQQLALKELVDDAVPLRKYVVGTMTGAQDAWSLNVWREIHTGLRITMSLPTAGPVMVFGSMVVDKTANDGYVYIAARVDDVDLIGGKAHFEARYVTNADNLATFMGVLPNVGAGSKVFSLYGKVSYGGARLDVDQVAPFFMVEAL